MFFIKKVIEFILFPPGFVILAFLLIALISFVHLIKEKIKSVGYIFISIISLFLAVILYSLSIQPVSNMLLLPLEASYSAPSAGIIGKPSATVILSSGAYNKNTLDTDSFNRLLEGFRLYKRYRIPIIVSGGRATLTFSVAKIMRDVLIEMGVKNHYIIIEDKSNDTYQNALHVLSICKKHHFMRIILVTSAYHMPRAMLLFNAVKEKMDNSVNSGSYGNDKYRGKNKNYKGGVKIIPYPTDFKTNLHYNIYGYFPQLDYLLISTEALHEYLGYVYYYVILKNVVNKM